MHFNHKLNRMLAKILIFCALFVAAQAGYPRPSYGVKRPSIAGYAAQLQPAVSLTVLPSYGNSYGPVPAYGPAPVYASPPVYAPPRSYGSRPMPAAGVDAEALRLAKLVFALPSPGGPNPAIIDIPKYSTTTYTSPAVVIAPGYNSNAVSSSSAAAAAANIKSAFSGYGPAPAPIMSSGYGPAPAIY